MATRRKEAEDQLQHHVVELEATREELESRTIELEEISSAAPTADQAKSEFLANMSHELRRAAVLD